MCIYKPVLGLSPECRCLSCLLNTFHHPILSLLPPPAEPSACVLKWSTVCLQVGKRRNKGRRRKKKQRVRRKQQRLSLLSPWWGCWPGSLPPLPYPPTLQTPFPPSAWLWHAKIWRRRERRTLFRRGIQAYFGWMVCTWSVQLGRHLWDNHELTGLMISPISPPLSCLPSCLSSL